RLLATAAGAYGALSQPDRELQLLADAHALAAPLGDDAWALEVTGRYGSALARHGRPAEAVALLEQARASAAAARLEPVERSLGVNLGLALAELGELEAAVAVLDPFVAELRRIGDHGTLARALFARANAVAAQRRFEPALADYREAEE